MEIGFIGVGTMGFHMVRRLLAAGHAVVAADVSPDAVARVTALGATAAKSPREVADRVETVMASLPSPQIVLQVATGKDGVIEGKKVRRFIDLSTTGASMAVRISEALAKKNIVQLDSPVSGGPAGAERGTLAVMVSGPFDEIEPVRDALGVFGKVFVIGERPGMGQTMKLANNFLSATAMVATSEAVVMGVKAGLDPALMIDVINVSSGRNTASMDKFPRSVLPRTFDYGFTNGLMDKDVRLCLEEANALGVPMRVAEVVRDAFAEAARQFGPDKDFTTIVKVIEQRAGVEVGAKKK
jgi:3-hydroxyisobutyrate dehydrogenase-like beta-hydroxyacid dehydrogenase